jgi:DNA invertase Pin-like site-specific DNA recombinase
VVVGRPREKLTDEKIARIRKMRAQNYSQRRIANAIGVSRGLVEHVLKQQEVA